MQVVGKQYQVLALLRVECASIGSAQLGFKPNEMGTHSLQSVAATEMYLASVLAYTIMLIGWWSSDAFLRYIQKQVEQFSKKRFEADDQVQVLQDYPRHCPTRCLDQGPMAMQPLGQCQDLEQYWMQ